MKVFYFTSTGNCLEVAKKIGGELYSIPQVLKNNQFEFEDDQIGIVFPSYMGNPPGIVTEFLEKSKFHTDYFFGIVTYGMTDMGTLSQFKKTVEKQGLRPKYLNRVRMVDNNLKLFDMENETKLLGKKNPSNAIEKIAQDLRVKKEFHNMTNYFMHGISKMAFGIRESQIKSNHKQFIIEGHCTNCGICEIVCPVNNISMKTIPVFREQCISCYGCSHNCPMNAIRVHGEKNRVRYRNSSITLTEIINANTQVEKE